MSIARAPLIARYTYRLHLLASVLEGAFSGIVITSDVVARKGLDATAWHLVFLTMIPPTTWLLCLHASRWVEHTDRKSLFLKAALFGRLPLAFIALAAGPLPFIGFLSLQWVVGLAIIPAQNVLFQRNYPEALRGQLYSRAMVAHWISLGTVSLVAGFVMDQWTDGWRWLYPAAAILGAAQCLVLGRIRVRRRTEAAAVEPPKSVMALLRETLWRNPGFRRFEGAMFLYGLGFMSMMPVIAILFVDELGMTYAHASMAKGVAFTAGTATFLGVAGRLHDRIGLERMTGIACFGLLLTSLSFAFATSPAWAIASYALFGISMAGIGVAWTLGSVKFAPEGAASRFMSAHMFLVGVRSLFGHPLGGWVADHFGRTRPTFLMAAGFFVIATALMFRAAAKSPGESAASVA
ncbi:MAG: MFS transporter [Planctomycetota bacterium]